MGHPFLIELEYGGTWLIAKPDRWDLKVPITIILQELNVFRTPTTLISEKSAWNEQGAVYLVSDCG